MFMQDFKILYQNIENDYIIDYDKLVKQYINLLYCYTNKVVPNFYKNLTFLKLTIIGFNQYHQNFVGTLPIPSDWYLKLAKLWNEINSKDINNLTNIDYLMLISVNIINELQSSLPDSQNLIKCIISNLYDAYATINQEYTLLLS